MMLLNRKKQIMVFLLALAIFSAPVLAFTVYGRNTIENPNFDDSRFLQPDIPAEWFMKTSTTNFNDADSSSWNTRLANLTNSKLFLNLDEIFSDGGSGNLITSTKFVQRFPTYDPYPVSVLLE